MLYKRLGQTGIEISMLSMGGHEYLADGRSRGFNENFNLAVTPGYIFEGFGSDRRKNNLAIAFEHGINLFDVTQDSEKEALGRNLKEIPPPYEIYIQTRPEGMVYTYDLYNRKMGQYDLLEAEVQRSLKLLKRDQLDFLNIAFMQSALDHDPEYLDKIKNNDVGDLGANPAGDDESEAVTATTKQEAGDKLDEIAKNYVKTDGLSYTAALDRAEAENPELVKIYRG